MATLRSWSNDSKGSLFDRLKLETPHLKVNGEDCFLQSIKNNLRNIFNARPGECHGSKGLGIIDVNDALLGTEEIHSAIRTSICDCIKNYEPRIVNIDIMIRQDPLSFTYYFFVVAYIRPIYDIKKIELEIHVNSNNIDVI